jgi:hypothetical protein
VKHQHLHIVHATEQALARPDVAFTTQSQNVALISNAVMEAASQMLALRTARQRQDLIGMENACSALGIQLRAAERLRQEVEIAIEQCRERV